jgi:hypothetical protein
MGYNHSYEPIAPSLEKLLTRKIIIKDWVLENDGEQVLGELIGYNRAIDDLENAIHELITKGDKDDPPQALMRFKDVLKGKSQSRKDKHGA